MYISKVHIKGFRNFRDNEITFNSGVNVIIGHNNSGKTNLLKALSLVFDNQNSKKLDVDDFNKNVDLEQIKSEPPQICIEVFINQSFDEDSHSDDLVTVANWLTKLSPPYEALLTYDFFLPEKEKANYKNELKEYKDINLVWQVIKRNHIRLYTYKIFGGDSKLQNVADNESLQKFDFQFLNAIRDVERDMLTGRNSLLRDVLDFFLDFNIKSDVGKSKEEKEGIINNLHCNFEDKSSDLIAELHQRMKEGKEHILSYASETGASFNKANPTFEGDLSEIELFSALKLIVDYEETGIKIPASHNGLGYNNLIYMSLLLAKMQVNSDGKYLGSNAKVFPILAIEEPEAHLHPAMQYKFLKFLRENKDIQKKVRQVFVTTHSTHITSAVSLDEIICFHEENNKLTVGYPGKVFDNDNGYKAKAYVQRFFDATKSNMLFAQKIILVEGLAEQLLFPTLARYLNNDLEDYHIAVINVGGRTFDYFLNLFDKTKNNTIPKKVACITDRDPERKKRTGGTFEKCYPFESNQDMTSYDYQDNASTKITEFQSHPNIKYFSQNEIYGNTFEYDLILYNPGLELLVTDSMKNIPEVKKLMELYGKNEPLSKFEDELRESDENDRIKESINKIAWDVEDKKKAIIAARYLNSVAKGENALELAYILDENLSLKGNEKYQNFIVPDYIKKAIEWICQ